MTYNSVNQNEAMNSTNDEKPEVTFEQIEAGLKDLKADPTDDQCRKKFARLLCDFYEPFARNFAQAQEEFRSKLRDALLPFIRLESFINGVAVQAVTHHPGMRQVTVANDQLRQVTDAWPSTGLIRTAELVLAVRNVKFVKP